MKIKINSKLTYRCTVSQIEGYIVITLVLKDYSNSTSREVQGYFMPTLKATQHKSLIQDYLEISPTIA